MKVLSILALICCLLSCKKENEIGDLKKEISSTWEIAERVDMSGFQAYPPGNGQIIKLYEDGRYERKQDVTVLSSGRYNLAKKKDCGPRQNEITISYDEVSSGTYEYVEIAEGKLVFSTPNCYSDGGTFSYRKVE